MTAYHHDFYRWTQEQAAALTARHFDAVDTAHVAKELELLGEGIALHLEHEVEQLVTELLVWTVTRDVWPRRRLASRIRATRTWIRDLLRASPSLKAAIPALLIERYLELWHTAQSATWVPLATWPEYCPWTPEQVLDADFWPEEMR